MFAYDLVKKRTEIIPVTDPITYLLTYLLLDFKLSPCSVCCMSSSG